MIRHALAALAAAVTCAVGGAAHAAAPQATVDTGALQGAESGDIDSFKGIPYAAAPVGPLRWRPPAAAAGWTGVRDATAYGPICPQPTRPDGRTAAGAGQQQSEDCLYLNVWTRRGLSHAPVMVWIHGGAFRFGSGEGAIYDGTAFARGGVILVTINYRLGALGWFAHPALTREAGASAPLANYGLMDQMAALAWVKRNVAAFGGDPGNVTVFGESAGGESVLALLATPSAAGLFAKAIVELGGGWTANRTLAAAEQDGIKTSGLGADATADQLRALPVDKLFATPMTLGGVGPITDGRLMPASITQAFAGGGFIHVPLIIGSNSFEASLMQAFGIAPATMLARTPPAIRALYPADDTAAANQIFTDVIMGAPARWIAARASAFASAWLYYFDYVPTARRPQPGTSHGGEIPFVFGNWDALAGALASPEDIAVQTRTHACWIAFARDGRPDCGEPSWAKYDPATAAPMEFGERGGPHPDFRAAQYDALQRVLLPVFLRTP